MFVIWEFHDWRLAWLKVFDDLRATWALEDDEFDIMGVNHWVKDAADRDNELSIFVRDDGDVLF